MNSLMMDRARQFQRARVGEELSRRLARGLRGVDRVALREALGLSEEILRQWLDGHAMRALDALALEAYLGLRAEYLLGGGGPARVLPGEKNLTVWREFLRVRAALACGRICVTRFRGRFDRETWREYFHNELAVPLSRDGTVVVLDFRSAEFARGVVREAYQTVDAHCQRYSSAVVLLLRQDRPELRLAVSTRITDALDTAELLARFRAVGPIEIMADAFRDEEVRLPRATQLPELPRVARDLELLPDEFADWRHDRAKQRRLAYALRALYADSANIPADEMLCELVVPAGWRSRRLMVSAKRRRS